MKLLFKYFAILIILHALTSCVCEKDTSEIEGRWKVDSVVKIESGTKAPERESYFVFKLDSTVTIEDEGLGSHEANWSISENNLLMIQNQDTTIMKVEELTRMKMVLITDLGEGDLRFTLLKEGQ